MAKAKTTASRVSLKVSDSSSSMTSDGRVTSEGRARLDGSSHCSTATTLSLGDGSSKKHKKSARAERAFSIIDEFDDSSAFQLPERLDSQEVFNALPRVVAEREKVEKKRSKARAKSICVSKQVRKSLRDHHKQTERSKTMTAMTADLRRRESSVKSINVKSKSGSRCKMCGDVVKDNSLPLDPSGSQSKRDGGKGCRAFWRRLVPRCLRTSKKKAVCQGCKFQTAIQTVEARRP